MLTPDDLKNHEKIQSEVQAWKDRQEDLIFCKALKGTFKRAACIARQENFRPFVRDWSLREVGFMRNPYLLSCEGCKHFFLSKEKPNPESRLPPRLRGIGLTQLGYDRKRQRSKDLRALQKKADLDKTAREDWLSQWRARRAAQQKATR